MRKLILIISFLTFVITSYSQESSLNRNDWIYWQNDKRLTFQDFNGKVGDCGPELIDDSIKIEVSACLGIWSILDVPKSWKKGVDYERFYFVPVFNVKKSWAKSTDSIAILKQQVFFDMTELATRWARKELYTLREETENATGTTAIFYSTIKKEMQEFKQEMYASYFDAVFRTNSLDSLQSWVDFTAEMLKETKEFETKEIEFERIITGKSEKGYKKAKKIIGPMN
jgi:hypothetical protein